MEQAAALCSSNGQVSRTRAFGKIKVKLFNGFFGRKMYFAFLICNSILIVWIYLYPIFNKSY